MGEPVPANPSDIIVGSWRLPAAVSRVPRSVWVFAVATLVDAVLRSLSFGGAARWQTRPLEAVFEVLTYLPAAAWMLLPGAVLLGGWMGRRGRLVLVGALFVAGSEAASLIANVVTFGPLGSMPSGVIETLARIRSVDAIQLAAAVLGLVGVIVIALGLRPARIAIAGSGSRLAATAVAVAALVGAFATGVSFAYPVAIVAEAQPDSFFSGSFITIPALLSQFIRMAAGLVWAVVACFAIAAREMATPRRRRWTLLSLGAGLLVIAAAMAALPLALAYTAIVTMRNAMALIPIYSTIHVVAMGCLLLGFAVPSRVDREPATYTEVPEPSST